MPFSRGISFSGEKMEQELLNKSNVFANKRDVHIGKMGDRFKEINDCVHHIAKSVIYFISPNGDQDGKI